MVDELLGLGLGEGAGSQVAANVDVQEGRDAADGHGGAVLSLDGGQVAEVEPLDGLAGVAGGLGDVEAVGLRHFLHAAQGADLLGDLLALTDHVVGHGAVAAVGEVLLLLGDQEVDAVEGHAAVVAHDAAAAIGVGQAGDDVAVASGAHLRRIGVEDGLVVGLVVLVEDLVVLIVHMEAIGLGRLLGHLDAAVGHEGTLEGLVGLKAHNALELGVVGVDVARAVGGQARDDLGLAVENAAVGALGGLELLHTAPKLVGRLGRTGEEALVAVVGGVVVLDEVANIDVVLPVASLEAVPFLAHGSSFLISCLISRRGGSAPRLLPGSRSGAPFPRANRDIRAHATCRRPGRGMGAPRPFARCPASR